MIKWVSALAGVAVFAATQAVGPASAGSGCGSSVLQAWSDGTLDDESFPVECYRTALDELPADVAGYSSAADDINRALLRRLRTLAAAGHVRRLAAAGPSSTGIVRRPQRLAALLVGTGIIGVAATLMLVNAHRRRRHG